MADVVEGAPVEVEQPEGDVLTLLESPKQTVSEHLDVIASTLREMGMMDAQVRKIEQTKVGKAAIIGARLLALDEQLGSSRTTDNMLHTDGRMGLLAELNDKAKSTRALWRKLGRYWERLQKETRFKNKPTFRTANDLCTDWYQKEHPDDGRANSGRKAAQTPAQTAIKLADTSNLPKLPDAMDLNLGSNVETELELDDDEAEDEEEEVKEEQKEQPPVKEEMKERETVRLTFAVHGDWLDCPHAPESLEGMFRDGLLELLLPILRIRDENGVIHELTDVDWSAEGADAS